jgi:hypothetical protein
VPAFIGSSRGDAGEAVKAGSGSTRAVRSQTSERQLFALHDGFGRAIVLPQLKVERLCSVVDGTADCDPKQTKASRGRTLITILKCSAEGWTDPHGVSLDWISANCRQPPDADRAVFFGDPWPALKRPSRPIRRTRSWSACSSF